MKNWIRKQFRKKARVYIMPTKMGGYLNGLVFLMFLLAIGYSNNLLLIFTLLLFGLNLIWLVQTHFHLHKLKLSHVLIQEGHAETGLKVSIYWNNSPAGPLDWSVNLESDQGVFALNKHFDNPSKSDGEIILNKRGVYRWCFMEVKTSNPFGLYQTWIYYPLNFQTVVFPPLLSSVFLDLHGQDLEGEVAQDKEGSEDFRGLKKYDFEEARKISWKHYASTNELLVKEGEEKKAPILDLELIIPDSGKENYLSKIATQIVECQKREIPFSFKSQNFKASANFTKSHVDHCLRVLALC